MGQCRKKREQLRVHGLLLLAYRLLRWPTIVTSRLPSSPAACLCPSGSRPFPLHFLLWGPFGHAATQVKFKPPWSKSASQNSSPPPPSPPPSPRFSAKTHFRKTDCFDKKRAREKTRFSVQKKHQTKRHQKHVLNDRPEEFISDEPTRASSSRRWRSSEEFQTTAEFERHDRRISKFRDRNWGKVFTLSVIKAPKLDYFGRGAKDDYQKNWDLGLIYQNELHTSMKNLAYALRRDD